LDHKPVLVSEPATPGGQPIFQEFAWAKPSDLELVNSAQASPGEFDLLDARSLMERGDYTGAVRRTNTALEALIGAKLEEQLRKKYNDHEVVKRLKACQNDIPERIRQWRKLSQSAISQRLFDEFEKTRKVRHGIVHRAERLTLADRGRAQRMVDTGRWLYNKIEGTPERAKLRDYGVLKSVGRIALTIRFPAKVINGALVLQPLTSLPGFSRPGETKGN
jgi:HEPN domain-containing protein